jgi:uncharacterized membrane protein YhaH (DUF805 family)
MSLGDTSLATPSPPRRLAPGPFALAVLAVYAASFVSQMLLSAPVTARLSVVPFVVVQAVLIWFWIVLHRRRLRDAGRPAGIAIGIAMIYVLEVVLLALLIGVLTSSSAQTGDNSTASVFHLFTIIYLIGMMSGESSLGVLQYWLMGLAVVMFLPVLVSIAFSIWTATRPSLSSPP